MPLAAVLAGLLIWCLYFAHQYNPQQGLNRQDGILSLDLAQVAERVASGRGFSTGFIRPLSLRFNDSLFHHPELTHPPLYILVLAAGIKLFGARDSTLVGVSVFFFWACLPLIWRLSRKIFGPVVAALTIFLYLSNPLMLRHSINGSPATFSAFLACLFLYFLYRSSSSPVWILAAGVMAGLGFLTRYSFGLWLFAAVLFLFLGLPARRRRGVAVLIIGALVVVSPWLIRNLMITGNPFFTLHGFKAFMFSDPRPGFILWRGFSAQSLLIPRKIFFALKKFLLGLRDQYVNVLFLTGNFASVFALTAILHRFENRLFDRLKYVFYVMILLEAAVFSLYRPDWNGMIAFIPVALIISSAFFIQLIGRISRGRGFWRGVAVILFLFLCLIPISNMLGPRLVPHFILYNPANIRSICDSVPPDSILISDVPWAVAWYGKRACLWLPYRMEDFEEIRIYHDPPLAGFYLTRFYFGPYFSPRERSPDWEKVYKTGWIPVGWDLKHKNLLPDNQIFISREPY